MKVIKPFLSAAVTKQEYDSGTGLDYPTLYIIDTENMVFYKRSSLAEGGHCILRIQELPKMEDVKVEHEEISFLPGGKVPGELLNQIVSFFRKVMDVNFGGANSKAGENCEAMTHILWHKKEKKYMIGIPTQTVSRASVNYIFDDLNQEDHLIVVDIHSHNTMGAFFSGTDDGDDKKGCWFAGVVGQLNMEKPALKFRFTNYGAFRDVRMEDLFDMKGEVDKNAAFPEEWMAKVKGRWESPKTVVATIHGRGQQYVPPNGRMEHLYGNRQRWPDLGKPVTPRNSSLLDNEDDDFLAQYAEFEKATRAKRRGTLHMPTGYKDDAEVDDYVVRIVKDAVESIEDLAFPVHAIHFGEIAEALRDQIVSGIKRLPSKDASFLLNIAELFLEEFSEQHDAKELGEKSNAAYLVGCIIEHSDWKVLVEIHKLVMDHIETFYEDAAHIDLALDYLEDLQAELTPEQTHRMRELADAKVCSDETRH